ncbi:protein Spindly-like [Neodiprion fabricii]|uniref:protein Spindly-like n=1 Tax=Neodiprion fabricii TaxID=2872261 RepID=UPI001ED92D07|nr:protein Spindly-like [Neodiprion fabricii]
MLDGGDDSSLKTNQKKTNEELKYEMSELNKLLNAETEYNEKYQQEMHEMRQKLGAALAMQKDLFESNELLEENLTRHKLDAEMKTNQLLEKFANEKKDYQEQLSELEASLAGEKKKNQELKERIAAKEKLLFVTARSESLDKGEELLTTKQTIASLNEELDKKEKVQEELLFIQQQLEETIVKLKKDYNEVAEILELKKADIKSLNEILETTKDELVICRSELESLKAVPASDSVKGNSLFAEVEDNRRELIKDLTSMKEKYMEMKETYRAKENEISALKAERATLLKRWKDDDAEMINHNASLIETYKARILELENKLKDEAKKLKVTDGNKEPVNNNFSYLQSLLATKKKEIEDLQSHLDESSTQKIIQEEIKCHLSKQLIQWRRKAMSFQAQALTAQNQIKCEDCLRLNLKDFGDANICGGIEHLDGESMENIASNLGEACHVDDTLEKLLQVPRLSTDEWKSSTASVSGLNNDLEILQEFNTLGESKEAIRSRKSIETCRVSLSPKKSIGSQESNKENTADTSNAIDVTLKSALVKPLKRTTCPKNQEKTTKSLRFTSDTVDVQKPKLIRQKVEKKCPVVFISTQPKK